MAYQVLARKWRPKRFADLVGQEHVVGALVNAIAQNRLHHAYLLTGTRGVGKTTIARILAKSLNCEQPDNAEPCGHCASCAQIDEGRFVDLLEIDAASNTGIDNIREVLENAQYAPTAGKYKVYIIDEVHMLSKSAFNAMLKTLEEPPEHVKFILATTDPQKVPITVLSRCLQFVLRNLTVEQIHRHLLEILEQENIAYEDEGVMLLARAGAGSMRDALSLLDQAIALGSGSVKAHDVRQMLGVVDKTILFQLFQSLSEENTINIRQIIDEMALKSLGFGTVLNEMALLLRDVARLQQDSGALDHSHVEYPSLRILADTLSSELVQLYYQCAIHGKKDLPFAPDEYSGFLMTILRMQAFAPLAAKHTPNDTPIEGSELHDPKPRQPMAADIAIAPNAIDQQNPKENHTRLPEKEPAPLNIENPLAIHTEQAETVESIPSTLEKNTRLPEKEPAPLDIENPLAIHTEQAETVESIPSTLEKNKRLPEKEPAPLDIENPLAIHTEQAETVESIPSTLEKNKRLPEKEPAPLDIENPLAINTEQAETVEQAILPDVDDVEMSIEITEETTLPLSTENWPAIVDALTAQLGGLTMWVLHSALLSADDGQIHLSFEDKAKRYQHEDSLAKLGAILHQHYQTHREIHLVPWQNDWQSVAAVKQQQAEQRKSLAIHYLTEDAQAQKIQQVFGGQWLPESVQLID